MRKNIKEYVGIDSQFKREDGTRMVHVEIYTKIVNDIGLEECIPYIPVSREEVRDALAKDSSLNDIPLEKWDKMHPSFIRKIRALGIKSVSLSDTVCTLKQAARMWAVEGAQEV